MDLTTVKLFLTGVLLLAVIVLIVFIRYRNKMNKRFDNIVQKTLEKDRKLNRDSDPLSQEDEAKLRRILKNAFKNKNSGHDHY